MKLNRISQRHWTILCLNRSSLPKWSVRTMKCHVTFNSKFKFLSELVRVIFLWRCSSSLLSLYTSFIATALFRMAWRLPHLSWNYCEWPLILRADNRCSQLGYFFLERTALIRVLPTICTLVLFWRTRKIAFPGREEHQKSQDTTYPSWGSPERPTKQTP